MIRFRSVLAVLAALLLAGCGAPHQYSVSPLNPPKPVADWTLPDQNEQPFQLSAQRGKVTLLYFGFTNCPDYCPTTLGAWKQIKQELGADADNVRFVLISTDPERDTPAALKAYVERFDPAFVGLRPTLEQLATLSREYGVGVQTADAAGTHSHDPAVHGTYTYALDRQGQLRLLYPYDSDPRAIAADLKALQAE